MAIECHSTFLAAGAAFGAVKTRHLNDHLAKLSGQKGGDRGGLTSKDFLEQGRRILRERAEQKAADQAADEERRAAESEALAAAVARHMGKEPQGQD